MALQRACRVCSPLCLVLSYPKGPSSYILTDYRYVCSLIKKNIYTCKIKLCPLSSNAYSGSLCDCASGKIETIEHCSLECSTFCSNRYCNRYCSNRDLWFLPLLCDNERLLTSDKVKKLLTGLGLGITLAVTTLFNCLFFVVSGVTLLKTYMLNEQYH